MLIVNVFGPCTDCCHSSPGGDSQVLLGVALEGVGTEAVINPVSSQKALIIQDDVAKCHRTHFLSPAQTEPLKGMINGYDFHLFLTESVWNLKAWSRCYEGVTAAGIILKGDWHLLCRQTWQRMRLIPGRFLFSCSLWHQMDEGFTMSEFRSCQEPWQ